MGRSRRPVPERLAEKLLDIRMHLKLTQREMADTLSEWLGIKNIRVYPGHISDYERGAREPPLEVLLHYARLVRSKGGALVTVETLIDDHADLPIYMVDY